MERNHQSGGKMMTGPRVISRIVKNIKNIPGIKNAFIEEDHCDGTFWIEIKVTDEVYDKYEEYYKKKVRKYHKEEGK